MTRGRIPAPLRTLVFARDAGRCVYCRCAAHLMGVTFEIDHITPRAAGGTTTLDNLGLCCPTCNRHKAARTHAPDPVSGESIRLFHPLADPWREHFEWREGATRIAGHTSIGRITAAALQMNRPAMVELRRFWTAMGLHPPP